MAGTTILLRRDTAANWQTQNPVLMLGEQGYDTTNKRLKIGDGTTAWNSLAYLPLSLSDYTATINVADFITKGPWVDVRAFMDGQSGRPTLGQWLANPSGYDAAPVFNAALASGAKKVIASGTYYIQTAITGLQSYQTLEGVGLCTINMGSTATGIQTNPAAHVQGFTIRNIELVGNYTAGQRGIDIAKTYSSSLIENVRIRKCAFGIRAAGEIWGNLVINRAYIGYVPLGDGASKDANATGIEIGTAGGPVSSGNTVHVTNSEILGSFKYGINHKTGDNCLYDFMNVAGSGSDTMENAFTYGGGFAVAARNWYVELMNNAQSYYAFHVNDSTTYPYDDSSVLGNVSIENIYADGCGFWIEKGIAVLDKIKMRSWPADSIKLGNASTMNAYVHLGQIEWDYNPAFPAQADVIKIGADASLGSYDLASRVLYMYEQGPELNLFKNPISRVWDSTTQAHGWTVYTGGVTTMAKDTTNYLTGGTSIQVTTDTQFKGIKADFTGLQPNTLYTAVAWVRSTVDTISIYATVGGAVNYYMDRPKHVNAGGAWGRLTRTFYSDASGNLTIGVSNDTKVGGSVVFNVDSLGLYKGIVAGDVLAETLPEPTYTTSAGVPTLAPWRIGAEHLDTTNNKWYKAKGTASSADWLILN